MIYSVVSPSLSRSFSRLALLGLAALCPAFASGDDGSLSDKELHRRLEIFDDDFLVEKLPTPHIENSYEWVQRNSGTYLFRLYSEEAGMGDIEEEVYTPVSDTESEGWDRHIGERFMERFEKSEGDQLEIVREVYHEYGYRVEIEPGITIPTTLTPDHTWEVDAVLKAYKEEDGSFVREGRMEAFHTYLGAYRVKTHAGVFDTILIREDFQVHFGPLSVDDDRLLFFAKGVGLVAEVEGIKASAVLVFRKKEKLAKLLVELPSDAE